MKHLSAEQIKVLKSKLMENLKKVETEVTKLEEDGCYEDLGTEEDDNAQEVANYETCLGIKEVETNSLSKIKKALERIENGTYGLCVVCKKEIPFERLSVRPESGRCVACKEKLGVD